MTGEVIYRKFERRDYESALKMIIDTWDYRQWVPERAVRAMGEYYLYELLAESDSVWVAEIDGAFAGILAAGDRVHHSFRPDFRLRQFMAQLEIELGRVGLLEFREFVQTQALDEELLEESGKEFDAELTLLITDAAWRGHGIGRTLYSTFLDWMRERELKTFYLFTDSSCDFGFYEREGMVRLAHRTFYWQPDESHNTQYTEEYYLYGGTIDSIESRERGALGALAGASGGMHGRGDAQVRVGIAAIRRDMDVKAIKMTKGSFDV